MANPNMIEWTTTDAPRKPLCPNNYSLEWNPDPIGCVNWMEHLPDDHKINKEWRQYVGTFIAERFLGYTNTDDTAYWMSGFPPGYALYCHHKTMPEGKQDRHDVYLYGSPEGKFRSPDEFLMHALWLMEGGSWNECKCKYSTGMPQIEINCKYNLPGLKVSPEKRRHSHSG